MDTFQLVTMPNEQVLHHDGTTMPQHGNGENQRRQDEMDHHLQNWISE